MGSNHPDIRGIRVGFISKIEIREKEDIRNFMEAGLASVPGVDQEGNLSQASQFGRGAVRIMVDAPWGAPVHLMTAHLKSKLLTYPKPGGEVRYSPRDENEHARTAGIALLKRTAEAVTLRVKANELLEGNIGTALILLGDLNDVPDAATTQILNGPSGSEIGTQGFNIADKGDDTRLFNLARLIPDKRRFSRTHNGNEELIDHIFASQELLPGKPRRLPVVDSYIDVIGNVPSIGDDPNTRLGEPMSDHAPIMAVFEL